MPETTNTFTASSGDGYELLMGRWSRCLAAPFVEFAGLVDGGKILDAGCGTGALSAELVRRDEIAEIVGVDFSEAYVDYARKAIQDPRIRFERGDVTALNFEDGAFDQILSHLVLQFVPDSRAAIAELSRILKPGGTMAATVWDSRGGLFFNRLFLDTAAVLDPAADDLRAKLLPDRLYAPVSWRRHGRPAV